MYSVLWVAFVTLYIERGIACGPSHECQKTRHKNVGHYRFSTGVDPSMNVYGYIERVTKCDHEIVVEHVKIKYGELQRKTASNFCKDLTKSCSAKLDFAHTSNVTHAISANVVGELDTFLNFMKTATIGFQVSFAETDAITYRATCQIDPGYEVWLAFQPTYVEVKGYMYRDCHVEKTQEDVHYEGAYSVQIPLEVSSDMTKQNQLGLKPSDHLADDQHDYGIVYCQTAPTANLQPLGFDYLKLGDTSSHLFFNAATLTLPEMDAVANSIENVMAKMTIFRSRAVANGTSGDSTAWAAIRCHNSRSRSVCLGCLTYLKAKLLKDCHERKGCVENLVDCQIRYELYPIDTIADVQPLGFDYLKNGKKDAHIFFSNLKLETWHEFEAVRVSIDNVLTKRGSREVANGSSADVSAWASTRCYNGISRARCTDCLLYLKARSHTECHKKRGCIYNVVDCQLRYELYPIEW